MMEGIFFFSMIKKSPGDIVSFSFDDHNGEIIVIENECRFEQKSKTSLAVSIKGSLTGYYRIKVIKGVSWTLIPKKQTSAFGSELDTK